MIKEFRIVGRLDTCWPDWFEGLEIRHTMDEKTSLPVTLIDRSALYGIPKKISSLNPRLAKCATMPPDVHIRCVFGGRKWASCR